MSTGAHLPDTLAGALEAMEVATSELEAVLGAEREALGRRDREAIVALAAEKNTLLERLEGLGRRQADLLRAQGYPATSAGLDALLAEPGAEALATRWHALRELLAACREQNQVNGSILRIAGEAMGRLLDLMRGTPQNLRLYGPGGTAHGSGGGTFNTRV